MSGGDGGERVEGWRDEKGVVREDGCREDSTDLRKGIISS